MDEFSLRLRWDTVTNIPSRVFVFFFDLFYQFVQVLIILLFKPSIPNKLEEPIQPYGKIAVIGAGLTGVSTAAHCIAHNFDVTLYDKNDDVGGIWSHVNSTSGLQINSLLYRFHPGVFWKEGFPKRDEILKEIRRIWKEYNLEKRTKFGTEVIKVHRVSGTGPKPDSKSIRREVTDDAKLLSDRSQWLVYTTKNRDTKPDGPFDAVVCTIGTCGEPQRIEFEGTDAFLKKGGRIVHSSELDQLQVYQDKVNGIKDETTTGENSSSQREPDISSFDLNNSQTRPSLAGKTNYADIVKVNKTSEELKGEQNRGKDISKPLDIHRKTIAIVGSGASGIEAAELAVEKGAKKVYLLSRDDKWIIPRNVIFDTLLAMQPFGREMPLSFIYESILTEIHYRDLADSVAPKERGLFVGTPVVNDKILGYIRNGTVEYIRCSTEKLTEKGVLTTLNDEGKKEREFEVDTIILATGFKRPSIDFLPKELFPEAYSRPNLYLQNFSTEDWSVLLTNASYMNAIGTVGHFHIGIYTRILLTFLLEKDARPRADDMKLWVDVLRFIKRGAPGGALGFFTYMELTIWLLTFHLFRPSRMKWMFFIMQGWGVTNRNSEKLKIE